MGSGHVLGFFGGGGRESKCRQLAHGTRRLAGVWTLLPRGTGRGGLQGGLQGSARAATLEAKASVDNDSAACRAAGDTHATISALASPPRLSCSSIVSLEFLRARPPAPPSGNLRASEPTSDLSQAPTARVRAAGRPGMNVRTGVGQHARPAAPQQARERGAMRPRRARAWTGAEAGARLYGTCDAFCMSAGMTLPSSSSERLMFCASVSVRPARRASRPTLTCASGSSPRPATRFENPAIETLQAPGGCTQPCDPAGSSGRRTDDNKAGAACTQARCAHGRRPHAQRARCSMGATRVAPVCGRRGQPGARLSRPSW